MRVRVTIWCGAGLGKQGTDCCLLCRLSTGFAAQKPTRVQISCYEAHVAGFLNVLRKIITEYDPYIGDRNLLSD